MDIKLLGSAEAVNRRPFTSPRLLARDKDVLSYLLEDLRALMASAESTGPIQPYESHEWTVHDLKRKAVICNPQALRSARREVCLVGFFGQRHLDRDGTALEEANVELVLEFKHYPGILSYSSMELVDGNWANLVLHDKPEAREYWRASHRHAEAAQKLSPQFYRSVRIHNGVLPRGVAGAGSMFIQRTKYWDFARPTVWQAVREWEVVTLV